MKDTVDIQEELDELFEKHRQSPNGYAFVPLADACRKLERIDEALEICNQGLAKHPNYASGHVVRAKCFYDQRDHDAARGAFKEVLDLDSSNLVALKFLGMIEADAGNFDDARDYLKNILDLDPENKEIKSILDSVDEKEVDGDAETVSAEIESAAEPDVEEAPFEGQPIDLGERTTEGSDTLETSDELATMTLADIFASQGYTQKAIKIYEELLKQQPGNTMVRGKIEALRGGGGTDEAGEKAVDVSPVDVENEMPTEAPESVPEVAPEQTVSDKTSPKEEPSADPQVTGEKHERRHINEENNLNHFKRWLNQVND